MSRQIVIESGFGWAICVAIALAFFFGGIAYSDAAKNKAKAEVMTACIQSGGNALTTDYGEYKECKR